jgi:RNA polymerase sigma-70 factor, ECF subfamily
LPESTQKTATDAELVEQAVAGDHSAYTVLVERHLDVVTKVVAEISGQIDDVEDVVQECFIRAYRGLRSFRGDAQFRTWLLRIAHNHAIKRSKMRARYRVSVTSNDIEVAEYVDPNALKSDDSTIYQEEHERMGKLIGRLPEHYRIVLVYFYYYDMTCEDIARVIDKPFNTVKAQLRRARQKLRTMILSEPEYDDWISRDAQ